jgi:FeS assembly SUF system protein
MEKKRLELPVMGDKAAPQAPAGPELPPDAPLEERVVAAIRTCYDPELPVNVYDLGLIYELKVVDGAVSVKMTLTSPACPVAGALPGDVQRRIAAVPGVREAKVELVWEPPWTKDRMSEEAQLQLGLF